MEGFFVFGPFGFVGGFLLGAAAYLLHSAGPKPFSTGLLWSAGIVLGHEFVIFLVPVLKVANEHSRRDAFNIQLEFEVPGESELLYEDLEAYRWGYAGESNDESASTQFNTQQFLNGVCVLPVALQMGGNPARRLVIFAHKSHSETLSIPPRRNDPNFHRVVCMGTAQRPALSLDDEEDEVTFAEIQLIT